MTDYISRADAIEAVRGLSVLVDDEDFSYFENALKALPSANCIEFDFNKYQPRVRNKVNDGTPSADAVHGEWIEREDWNGDYYYDCSVCGESFVLCDGTPSMNLYHFCPNCGARMKGGDSE